MGDTSSILSRAYTSSLNSGGVYLGYPLAIANLARAAMSKACELGEDMVTADVMHLVQP